MYPLIICTWTSRWSHKVSTGGGYNDIFYGLELLENHLKKDTTVQNETRFIDTKNKIQEYLS